MISNGGPRRVGSEEAVKKDNNGNVFQGIILIGHIKLHHYTSVHIKKYQEIKQRNKEVIN